MTTSLLQLIPLLIYLAGVLFLFLFSLSQLDLLLQYLFRKNRDQKQIQFKDADLPAVTIQLPVYNEKEVIIRLLHAVTAIQYPAEKLEIQILDDSMDETSARIDEWMNEEANGFNVKVIRRNNRAGFKAGALQHGLEKCSGELIAIFDADFVPPPDFLLKTVNQFNDPAVGAVQTRWGHLNEKDNALTRLQAFGLDAHFTIEQQARHLSGVLLNFNGSAGIWRKSCIQDSGGWSADTLTEDLDLSFRAQMKGWRMVYDPTVICPAELPANLHAVIAQQQRWNKGGAESARKLAGQLWRAGLSLHAKIQGTFQLLASSIYPALFFASVASLILFWTDASQGQFLNIEVWGAYAFIGFLSLILVYGVSAFKNRQPFWWALPAFLILNMGLAFRHTKAVVTGWLGKQSPFVRTPKTGGGRGTAIWKQSGILNGTPEWLMASVYLYTTWYAIQSDQMNLVLFHGMMGLGTLCTAIFLLRDR